MYIGSLVHILKKKKKKDSNNVSVYEGNDGGEKQKKERFKGLKAQVF